MTGMKVLAIIPARGGSKGLPGKNIRPLLGKPLIGWTIEQARASRYITDIFVSTDSQKIADVAETFGVSVPELRPAELAGDTAPSSGFVVYTIEKLRREGKEFDYIILLQPTSPLRETEDIDRAIELLDSRPDADSAVGVCAAECAHPAFMVRRNGQGLLVPYQEEMKTLRRQEIGEVYYFEGTVYVTRPDAYLQKQTFYHDKTLPYIVPKSRAFEVDDLEDWFIIESILKNKIR